MLSVSPRVTRDGLLRRPHPLPALHLENGAPRDNERDARRSEEVQHVRRQRFRRHARHGEILGAARRHGADLFFFGAFCFDGSLSGGTGSAAKSDRFPSSGYQSIHDTTYRIFVGEFERL